MQRLAVAAPGGKRLDRGQIDEIKAAVFATIEMVNRASEEEMSSGTFAVAGDSARGAEETA